MDFQPAFIPCSRHRTRRSKLPWLITSLVLCAASAPTAFAQQSGTGPVKVYVMIGQSNMEGQ